MTTVVLDFVIICLVLVKKNKKRKPKIRYHGRTDIYKKARGVCEKKNEKAKTTEIYREKKKSKRQRPKQREKKDKINKENAILSFFTRWRCQDEADSISIFFKTRAVVLDVSHSANKIK